MAEFIRGTGNNCTPLEHSKDMFRQYLLSTMLSTMIGKKDSGKPIIVDHTLDKKAGDTTRFHFIPKLTGNGIEGQDASITGNEKTLVEYYMDIGIDQLAQAVAKKGKMTDKRIIWNFRTEATKALTDWFAEENELRLIYALTGKITNGYTIDNSPTLDLVNGSGRMIESTGADSFTVQTAANSDDTAVKSNIASTDKINIEMLESMQIVAKTGNSKYAIRPIKLSNGEEYYILLLHPIVARDLRATTAWKNRAQSIIQAGISAEKDPIATGACGVWNRIIVKECERILTTDAASSTKCARNLLLGANACGIMYGQTLDYNEEFRDHKRILSCSADEIAGRKKFVFDGVDQGVIQVVTACNL